MGDHIDNRNLRRKKDKKDGDNLDRKRRVTFKNYIKKLDEDLLEDDFADDEFDEDQDDSTNV